MAGGSPAFEWRVSPVWLLSVPPLLAILYLLSTPHFALAPLLAIALVVLVGLFLRPAMAFWGVVFIIPFGAYRAIAGTVKLDWVLAGIALLVVLLQAIAQRRLPDGLRNTLWWWWLGLLLLFLFSLYGTQWPETVAHNLRNLVAAGLFMALAMIFIDRRVYVGLLPDLIIASITLGSMSAVLGFLFQIELFADEGGFTRGTGLTADPNNLALFVIFVTPLLVERLINGRPGLRPYYGLALVVNIAALVSTYSRGGLIAFVLCLMMLAWAYRHHFKVRHLGIALMLVLLASEVLIATVPASYWERQISLTQGKDFAVKRRSSYLEVGMEAFRAAPLLGHGAGTFRDIYGESSIGAEFEKEGKTRRRFAHNSYLELLVGNGLVGALLYAGMLVFALLSIRHAQRLWRVLGHSRLADQTAAYQTSLTITLLYLFIFSEPLHKYLLLLLALSQVALMYARRDRAEVVRPG